MDKISVKQKLNHLEAEVQILKTAVNQRPDFKVDDINWKKIKSSFKKSRNQTYKEVYG